MCDACKINRFFRYNCLCVPSFCFRSETVRKQITNTLAIFVLRFAIQRRHIHGPTIHIIGIGDDCVSSELSQYKCSR